MVIRVSSQREQNPLPNWHTHQERERGRASRRESCSDRRGRLSPSSFVQMALWNLDWLLRVPTKELETEVRSPRTPNISYLFLEKNQIVRAMRFGTAMEISWLVGYWYQFEHFMRMEKGSFLNSCFPALILTALLEGKLMTEHQRMYQKVLVHLFIHKGQMEFFPNLY